MAALILRRVNILYEGKFLANVAVELPVPVVDADFVADAIREALQRGILDGLHLHALSFSVADDDTAPARSRSRSSSG